MQPPLQFEPSITAAEMRQRAQPVKVGEATAKRLP
jgi:hypothetical protein